MRIEDFADVSERDRPIIEALRAAGGPWWFIMRVKDGDGYIDARTLVRGDTVAECRHRSQLVGTRPLVGGHA